MAISLKKYLFTLPLLCVTSPDTTFAHGMGKVKEDQWLTPGITLAGSSHGPVFGVDVGLVHNEGEKPADQIPWTFYGGWFNYAQVINSKVNREDGNFKRLSAGVQYGARFIPQMRAAVLGMELGVAQSSGLTDEYSTPMAGIFTSIGFVSAYYRGSLPKGSDGAHFREFGVMLKFPFPLSEKKKKSQF